MNRILLTPAQTHLISENFAGALATHLVSSHQNGVLAPVAAFSETHKTLYYRGEDQFMMLLAHTVAAISEEGKQLALMLMESVALYARHCRPYSLPTEQLAELVWDTDRSHYKLFSTHIKPDGLSEDDVWPDTPLAIGRMAWAGFNGNFVGPYLVLFFDAMIGGVVDQGNVCHTFCLDSREMPLDEIEDITARFIYHHVEACNLLAATGLHGDWEGETAESKAEYITDILIENNQMANHLVHAYLRGIVRDFSEQDNAADEEVQG